jgi:hypothetical protein
MNQLRKLFTKPKVSPKQVMFKAPKVASGPGNAKSRAIAILKASKQVTKKKPVVKITKK